MKRNKYFIDLPLEYIAGHLRYGHLEGEVELTDEEYNKLMSGDEVFREEIIDWLDLVIDDYSCEYAGNKEFENMTITKVKEQPKIEISIFEKDNQLEPPEHYGFYDSINEAIRALQELKERYNGE